jgi:hypothetical protein
MVTTSAPVLSWVVRDSAESARRRLGEAAHPTAADVRGVLELHHLLTDLLRRDWEAAQRALEVGLAADRLRAILEPIRDGANAQLDVVPRLRNLSRAVGVSAADLEADDATLRALREGATKLLDWLAAPWPPIDEDMLAQSRRDIELGRVESGDSILARLRAGEDV